MFNKNAMAKRALQPSELLVFLTAMPFLGPGLYTLTGVKGP